MSLWPAANVGFQAGVRTSGDSADSWFFVIRNNELLLRFDDAGNFQPLSLSRREEIAHRVEREHFLGLQDGTACFAVEVASSEGLEFGGLRSIFGRTDNTMLSLAGRALQVCEWYHHHQFCGRCGRPTEEHPNDRAMVCGECGIHSYPRLSPSIIVLVHRDDEVLLARNHRFPEGMYSTLAGFVEPGESIEETLRREVHEEVGVHVGDIRYLGSQPWPFPNSLMLGFHAEYAGGDIVLQEDEIADARWFPVNALPEIPAKVAISRWLIDDYLQQRGIAI